MFHHLSLTLPVCGGQFDSHFIQVIIEVAVLSEYVGHCPYLVLGDFQVYYDLRF